MSRRWLSRSIRVAAVGLALGAGPAFGQDGSDADLTSLSLEDLMNLEVTSVSKQKQRIGDAPAAISVITQDDIRQSGMSNIPDLLRMSPGVNVAQIDASRWAVSVRGFNDLYANKLLVLMDGRSVYVPLFSGVYWDAQDYVLDDLEQIEVIRGPGATLWGANAVNGVININSKPADATQGWLAETRVGTQEDIGAVRYGGQIDDRTYYRAYTKFRYTENFETAADDPAEDRWNALRGGFRIDRYATEADTLTLQGDAYRNRGDMLFNIPSFTPPSFIAQRPGEFETNGAYVLGRWTHRSGPDSDMTFQAYYDYFNRVEGVPTVPPFEYDLHTIDLDFQHRFQLTPRNQVIWGLGYRFSTDDVQNISVATFDPTSRDMHLYSAFIQDDLTIVPDKLHLIAGTKFEHNSFSGFEVQPSVRGIWTPNERNAVWAAVSRAMRTPNRADHDGRFLRERTFTGTAPPVPTEVMVFGNDSVDSEELLAYELGYRVQLTRSLSLDTTAFYNRYDDLTWSQPGAPFLNTAEVPPRLIVPFNGNNDFQADAYGAEVAANWAVNDDWRLTASYTYLQVNEDVSDPTGVPLNLAGTGMNPQHQVQLRSSVRVGRDLMLNGAIFYVDGVDQVSNYVRLDANLDWTPVDGLSAKLGIQNALDDRHREAAPAFNTAPNEVPLAVYGQLTWEY